MSERCRCNCGYTCNRQCDLPIMECMDQHYVKDCDHDWDGWEDYIEVDEDGTEHVRGGSRVCKHCGTSAMAHDSARGP
jgi:hypothetical protein